MFKYLEIKKVIFLILVSLIFCASTLRAEETKLTFANCYITLGPKVVKVHAGYCTIKNETAANAVITGASSDAYGRLELHRSEIKNGIAVMRQLKKLDVAPGQTLIFNPEGLHFMLMQPKVNLQAGSMVRIDIKMADGSVSPVDFEVKSMRPMHKGSHHGHGSILSILGVVLETV